MDIRSYFGASTSSSVASSSSCVEEEPNSSDSDSNVAEPAPKQVYREPLTTKRKYSKNWEKEFSWLVMTRISMVLFPSL